MLQNGPISAQFDVEDRRPRPTGGMAKESTPESCSIFKVVANCRPEPHCHGVINRFPVILSLKGHDMISSVVHIPDFIKIYCLGCSPWLRLLDPVLVQSDSTQTASMCLHESLARDDEALLVKRPWSGPLPDFMGQASSTYPHDKYAGKALTHSLLWKRRFSRLSSASILCAASFHPDHRRPVVSTVT